MVEGDFLPSNLLEEIAGKPREKQPLTLPQEANLAWWDNRIIQYGIEMQKEKDARKQSDEYQRRTIPNLPR